MNIFAKIENNSVTEILNVQDTPFQLETLLRAPKGNIVLLVNVNNIDPQPQVGWVYDNGSFHA
jgi:hypothetical protein